jgi:hypothetical protein
LKEAVITTSCSAFRSSPPSPTPPKCSVDMDLQLR